MLIRLISPKPEHLYGPPSDIPLPIFTIIYLAALTPSDFDVEIIDEGIAEIPYDKKADLVGITVMSGSDVHAYEIAENNVIEGSIGCRLNADSILLKILYDEPLNCVTVRS